MIEINSVVAINRETLEVFDKQFDNGISPLTANEVQLIKENANRMKCKVPSSVIIYDYISQNVKYKIKDNFETHLKKMKSLI
jgi:hypothetical protein